MEEWVGRTTLFAALNELSKISAFYSSIRVLGYLIIRLSDECLFSRSLVKVSGLLSNNGSSSSRFMVIEEALRVFRDCCDVMDYLTRLCGFSAAWRQSISLS